MGLRVSRLAMRDAGSSKVFRRLLSLGQVTWSRHGPSWDSGWGDPFGVDKRAGTLVCGF